MKRFLGVLIASMFLASAAIAAEKAKDKMGEEKKAPAAEGAKTEDEKKAAKGDKKAAKGDKKAAKGDKKAAKDEAATSEKSEKMKDEKKAAK